MNTQPSTQQPSIQSQNLDRLHVQWVLGKNRGVEQPLVKEQLVQLLEANRLHWDQLNKLEQRELLSDQNLVEQAEVWMQNKHTQISRDISKEAIKAIALLVEGLQVEAFEQWQKSKPEVDWSAMHPNLLKGLAIDRFKYVYGTSPGELKRQLVEYYCD